MDYDDRDTDLPIDPRLAGAPEGPFPGAEAGPYREPQTVVFEGKEVLAFTSKLKGVNLEGVLARSELKPDTIVEIRIQAIVVGVNHKRIKDVPDCLERIQTLEAIVDRATIVEATAKGPRS